MFNLSILLTFSFALSSIASSLLAGDVSTTTSIAAILMTTVATEAALYFGAE